LRSEAQQARKSLRLAYEPLGEHEKRREASLTRGHVADALRLYLPLLLIGAAAGLIHLLARRARDPRRRRLYDIAWILLLLAGAPVWLFVAAALRWI